MTVFKDIEKFTGIKLPADYENFADQIDDFLYVSFNEFPDEFPDDEGVSWFMWGKFRLQKIVMIDSVSSKPAWNQLQSFAELDKKTRKRTQERMKRRK